MFQSYPSKQKTCQNVPRRCQWENGRTKIQVSRRCSSKILLKWVGIWKILFNLVISQPDFPPSPPRTYWISSTKTLPPKKNIQDFHTSSPTYLQHHSSQASWVCSFMADMYSSHGQNRGSTVSTGWNICGWRMLGSRFDKWHTHQKTIFAIGMLTCNLAVWEASSWSAGVQNAAPHFPATTCVSMSLKSLLAVPLLGNKFVNPSRKPPWQKS